MRSRIYLALVAALLACVLSDISNALGAEPGPDAKVRLAIDAAMQPVIEKYQIPGLAIAVTIGGRRHFVEYGLASKAAHIPVTRNTLFELGSISKTFIATLATYAEIDGKLTLNDDVGKYMPELKGSDVGNVRLLDLGTHTAGGFPLQLPDDVKNQKQLIAYYRAWKPQFAAGTYRSYANPSIGLLGLVTAKSMGSSYATSAAFLFRQLGLRRTYIDVPTSEMKSYAWGYSDDDKPIRVSPAPLATEAYGVKSNAIDMIRFLEVNMGIGTAPGKIARAVNATHIGYFRAGELIQDLIWEQYPYPIDLDKIVEGNSAKMTLNSIPATAIDPPMAPQGEAILNKTGSTNGFGAYVAFVPAKKIGIVMLANKNYPNGARVRAAYRVLSRLTE